MKNDNLNDFIVDIAQDICEIQSVLKVLKDSAHNENSEINLSDVGNTLEIIVSKMSNIKYSLEKYIDSVFK